MVCQLQWPWVFWKKVQVMGVGGKSQGKLKSAINSWMSWPPLGLHYWEAGGGALGLPTRTQLLLQWQ